MNYALQRDCSLHTTKAFIFDMDGVIFDTERIARRLWRRVFSDYGYHLGDDDYKKVIGRSMHATFQVFTEEYGPGLPIEEMVKAQDLLWQETTSGLISIKEGVVSTLDYLNALNIPCAVGSSTYQAEVEKKLSTNGLSEYFQVFVGGDSVDYAKPAPDIFLKCSELLGVGPENCLVIEDSNNGLRAANAAGIPAVMIPDLIPANEIDSDLSFVAYDSLLDLQRQLERVYA